jgi:cytochrome c2
MKTKFLRFLVPICLLAVLIAGCSDASSQPEGENTVSGGVEAGQRLFQQHCASCHSTKPDTVVVGPSLAGVAGRASTRVQGESAHDYLQESILKPSQFLVDGYQDLMPISLASSLSESEVEALVAYLMTMD